MICLYYLQQIGFTKSEKGSLNHFGFDNKELDLYNPDFFGFKIGLEYDGYVSRMGGHTIEKDLEKNNLCHNNGIILYRIREPQLLELNSTSRDFVLENGYVKSKSLENTLKLIIIDLESLSGQSINIDIDFSKDEIEINNFIKNNYQSRYREERVGERKMMHCGFEAEIIEYIDNKHISIQFLNDGTIVKNIKYEKFNNGAVMHPNRHKYSKYLSETKTMSCGLEATVTEYFGCRNCTVTFSDGTVVKNVNHAHFRKGQVGHPNINPGAHTLKKQKDTSSQEKIYIGMVRIMSNGQKAKLTKHKNKTHVSVEFEDGTVIEDTRLRNFLRGHVQNPNYNKYACRLNETRMMNCGMEATITSYLNTRDIAVRFADGTMVEHKDYGCFKKGSIGHPNIQQGTYKTKKKNKHKHK